MSGIVKIEIVEAEEELKELLRATKNQEIKERIQTLYWLKSSQINQVSVVANNLFWKHRTKVSRWLSSYRKRGISGSLEKGKSSGRNKKLAPSLEASLKQELEQPEGFSSYKEVQTWLKVVHEIEMSYSGVH